MKSSIENIYKMKVGEISEAFTMIPQKTGKESSAATNPIKIRLFLILFLKSIFERKIKSKMFRLQKVESESLSEPYYAQIFHFL